MILSDRNIYIGYDIGDDYSQISYYCMGMKGPTSISTITGADKFLIPTAVALKENGQWTYGDDAIACKEDGRGVVFQNIIKHSLADDFLEVEGETISYYDCLRAFVKKTMKLVNIAVGRTDEKKKIVFTTRVLSPEMVYLMEKLCNDIFSERDTIMFHSHKDSIFNYILFQDKELWANDVVLFDYGNNNFNYYYLKTNRNVKPHIVYIEEDTDVRMIGLPREERDKNFLSLVERVITNRDKVGCVYLTGVTFNDKWLDDSLKVICRNRRAFIGQNLFAEGACYKAISSEEERSDYMYLGEARLPVNIGVTASFAREEQFIPILNAGANWYDSLGIADIILDDTNTIELEAYDMTGELKVSKRYELLALPNRPARTTRIRITLKPEAVNRIKVTFEDMGFGEMYRRSGKMWNFMFEY